MRRFLPLLLTLLMLPACVGASPTALTFEVMNEVYRTDYRQIPGVSADDILAIQAMQEAGVRFTLGTLYSGEAFVREDGTRGGFSVLLCDMLTEMIGIPFDHVFYDWDGLVDALNSQTLDFAGELTPTPERHTQYIMTDGVYERTVKVFRNRDAAELRTISRTRTLRFGVQQGTVTGEQVQAVTDMPCEIIYVRDYLDAATQLRNGTLDAFFGESPSTYYFRHLSYIPVWEGPVGRTDGRDGERRIDCPVCDRRSGAYVSVWLELLQG